MKVKNTGEVLGAIDEQIKSLQAVREFWDSHMVKNFPSVLATALRSAGDMPAQADETMEVLQHHLSEVAAGVEQARHFLAEAAAEMVQARTRATRGAGTSNFKV